MSNKITVYTKNSCPQCEFTKRVLKSNNVAFEERNLDTDEEALEIVKGLGFAAAPVVVAEGKEPFSGFQPDKLEELF